MTAALAALWLALWPAFAGGGRLLVDDFSSGAGADGLPAGWKPLLFKRVPRRTAYAVAREGENSFVLASSSASASAIYKEVPVDLGATPVLTWRWRVDRVLAKADATRKSGDDYPARVYVAFAYDPAKAGAWEKARYGLARTLYGSYPPKAALNYVWDNRLPVGTVIPNAYTDRARMVVVESGAEKAGRWAREERDVLEDYRKAFGVDPPKIAFIALMTDTDDTVEEASAGYDDLAFLARGDAPGGHKE